MIEGIDIIQKEIHENAVAHGWWESDRSFGEICALIHSELSEALEEYRNNQPNVYWITHKPEGIAVELADAVIRILDYMERDGYHFDTLAESAVSHNKAVFDDFGDFITRCHSDISDAYFRQQTEEDFVDRTAALSVCIARIGAWFEANGLDLSEVIALKHAYNKSRPYRHGGKKI